MQNHEEAKKKSWLKETVTTSRGYHKHVLPPMVDSMKKATPINTAFNVRQLLLFLFFSFFLFFLPPPTPSPPSSIHRSYIYEPSVFLFGRASSIRLIVFVLLCF